MRSKNLNIRATEKTSEFYKDNNIGDAGALSALVMESFPDLFSLTIDRLSKLINLEKLEKLSGFAITVPCNKVFLQSFNQLSYINANDLNEFELFCLQLWLNSNQHSRNKLVPPEPVDDLFFMTPSLMKKMLDEKGLKFPHRANISLWKTTNKLIEGEDYKDRLYSKSGYDKIVKFQSKRV